MKSEKRMLMLRGLAAAALLFSLVVYPFEMVYAATLTVTHLSDTNDGICNSTHCTLREAINAANSTAAADTINFKVNGTITLGSSLPAPTSAGGALIIDGSGKTVAISGGGLYRVLYIASGVNATLKHLTIRDGYTSVGAGIYNQGTLTIEDSSINGNQAIEFGGGIYNEGTLTTFSTSFNSNGAQTGNGGGLYVYKGDVELIGGTFMSNYATVSGGAIYNRDPYPVPEGDVIIHGTSFLLNVAAAGDGGAIKNEMNIEIEGSTFALNTAEDYGGAFYNEAGGRFQIQSCSFNYNEASFHSGGGLYAENVYMGSYVRDSVFNNNSAGEDGGGFSILYGTIAFNRTIIKNNDAGRNGGGGRNFGGSVYLLDSTLENNSADQYGGAVYSQGNLTIERSTFSGNTAEEYGGAVYLGAGAPIGLIRNSTFYDNDADRGGALYLAASTYVKNCTMSGNSALSGGGGALHGILTIWVYNSIFADSPSGGNCATLGTIPSNHGNNIDSGSTCGWSTNNGSMSNTPPLLGTLRDNGGHTETMMPLAISPAIEGVDYDAPYDCPGEDQRGYSRPHEDYCDIGAVEAYYPLFLPGIYTN